ncbi:UPF0575 protein C19orf67 homolog [Electrophorus electricus]|uniref:UPF0575 protein C19orf67 homolog n=1 Tax=Electrophorus electricus TaxID=8005 RepID=UPI0015CFBC8B|nr:UPF0575 protein C19orf67 homolog [Electrophorus electricus]
MKRFITYRIHNHKLFVLNPLDFFASVIPDSSVLAPFAGEEMHCAQPQRAATPSQSQMRIMDNEIHHIEEQLHYLLSKTDEFQDHLLYSQGCLKNKGFAEAVQSFLRVCQLFFTYLESLARDSFPDRSHLHPYIRHRLLHFTQRMCTRLEQMVLMFASFGWVSLEESDPSGYFLCCEDIPVGERGGRGEEGQTRKGMWSIGQWVQTYPDPNADHIYDWVLCAVPQGQYKQLVCLGEKEPLNCIATDYLLEALFSGAAPSISHGRGPCTVHNMA